MSLFGLKDLFSDNQCCGTGAAKTRNIFCGSVAG
jgi:hypothetical protein